jgi:hypothetical protein
MNYVSPLSKVQNRIRQYTMPRIGTGGLTPSEQQLRPYIQAEQAKRKKKRNWLKPIEVIFDILQRGQYVTANVAEQMTRNVRGGEGVLKGVGREAWQGLTGQDKGDWEHVLFGGADKGKESEEFEGIFKDAGEGWEKPLLGEWAKGKPVIGATGRGLTGLAANILLDPTTYISFGTTSGARAAATKYADDVAKLALKGMAKNPEMLAKLAKVGGDDLVKQIVKLADTNAPEALKLLQKYAGTDLSRHMAKVVKGAKKEGLRLPEKALKGKMLGQVGELRTAAGRKVKEGVGKKIASLGDELADYGPAKGLSDLINESVGKYVSHKEATTGLKYLDDLAKSIGAGRYGGAGTRTARFMRKEIGTGERYPAVLQAWDKVGKWFADSKMGGYFSDAWWSVMNKGPVGKLKKMFNVRNPYQEILARTVQDARAATTDTIARTQQGLKDLFKTLEPDDLHAIREVMIAGQGGGDLRTLAANMGVLPERIDLVMETVGSINQLTQSWSQRLQKLVQDGIIRDVGEIENYLPIRRTGTGFYKKAPTEVSARHPGFLFARTTTWGEQVQSEAAKLRFLFPEISEEAASKLVKEGAGDVQTDLFQMLMGRGMAQARLEQRSSIIKQFREMGFNLKQAGEMNDELAKVMVNNATVLQQFGLKAVADDALEGYLFDKEMADILERAIKVTANDESLKIFSDAIGSFTAWWKAWATASPGFHFRNHYSNNVTGLLKHGVEWLNPKANFEAWAGTVAALSPKDAFKKLIAEGVDAPTANAILAKSYGGKTVEELSNYASRNGVIARHVMGFDAPATLDDVMKKGDSFKKINPLSKEFAPLQGSYQLSQYVENTSRFHSFLLDYKRAVKQGSNPETAMEYAKYEAKKWFIDYDDLSMFEKNVMKKVIPFYTWLRKNIANQIHGMFDFREMYSMLPKMIKGQGGVEKGDMPEWMRDAGFIDIGEEDSKATMFWPNLPHMDLNKIPIQFQMTEAGIPVPRWGGDEVLRDVISNSHPLIKTAVEMVGRRDVFYGEELDENLKAPRLTRFLAGKEGDARVLGWLDGFLRMAGWERGLDPDVNEDGQLTLNPIVVKALDNNVLFLKRIPQYFDLPEVVLPALEEAKNKVGSVGDYEKADQQIEEIFQILSFYAGIKMKQLDLGKQEGYESYDVLKSAEEARSQDLKRLPGYVKKKADYINRSMKRQKRLGL